MLISCGPDLKKMAIPLKIFVDSCGCFVLQPVEHWRHQNVNDDLIELIAASWAQDVASLISFAVLIGAGLLVLAVL